ncbi:MAG: hypothetical protein KDE28_12495 [Anaerolineales bacterium]|nr:hypothetical protein [Anaerolineales bacterium]
MAAQLIHDGNTDPAAQMPAVAACLAELERDYRPAAKWRALYFGKQKEAEAKPQPNQQWKEVPTQPAGTHGKLPPRPAEMTQHLTKSAPMPGGGLRAWNFTPKNEKRFLRMKGTGTIYPSIRFDPAHEYDKAKHAVDQLLQEMAWGETEGRQYYVIHSARDSIGRAVKALNKRRTRGGNHRWIAGGGLDLDTGDDTGRGIIIYSSAGGPLQGHESQVLRPDRAALFTLCMDLIRVPATRNLAPHRGELYAWGYQLNATRKADRKPTGAENDGDPAGTTDQSEQPSQPAERWELTSSASYMRLVELASEAGYPVRKLKGRSWAIDASLEQWIKLHFAKGIEFSISQGDDEIVNTVERVRAEKEGMSRISPLPQEEDGEIRDIVVQTPLIEPPEEPEELPVGGVR